MSSIIQNNDVLINGTVRIGDEPFDLTSCSIRFAIFNKNSSTPLIEKSTLDGITITDPAAGKYEVDLTAAETVILAPGTLIMETLITDPSGNQYTAKEHKDKADTLTVIRSYIR